MGILFTFVKSIFMKERILEFLKRENKSSAQLAEEIGVQPSGISHILSGRNNPSLDFILKMLEKYKYISTDWLLFGKGDMYKEAEMRNLFEINSVPVLNASDNLKVSSETPVNQTATDNFKEPDQEISGREVEKIVWFYDDKSFVEYFPSR